MTGTTRDGDTAQDWGRLHVMNTCCGAGTCRNFAPELLGEVAPAHWKAMDGAVLNGGPAVLPGTYEEGAFTGVIRQPRSQAELEAARTAVAACPFGALRLKPPAARVRPGSLGAPWRTWPRPIEDNVWVLGSPSRDNAGAMAYFIERPDGNVLVDLPKPNDALFRWLDEHGGVRWIFLTHRDHAEHHAEYAARFPGSRRILGASDVNLRGNEYRAATSDVEIQLGDQLSPVTLEGVPIPEASLPDAELAVIPQPGHTPGSLCLIYRGRFLFSGDHLAYSRRLGQLMAFRLQCWENWDRQTRSVRRLVALAEAGHLGFAWVLPGHGEWQRLDGDGGPRATAEHLRRVLFWMERQASGHVSLSRYILFVQSRMYPRSKLARAMHLLGGKGHGSEAWLLPHATRPYLPDHEPSRVKTALLRATAITTTALGAAVGLAFLATRAVRAAR
ncbi:MBL fold metallo-hydrolase [Chondromyces crocatus]|uniref:MBL fold metallo-hydrolase n=1 Tax=Chondromyces crocatus TaxID=52 RepID=A0A0K1EQU0_CHOCO|nr:MBL fold metallo-hydrolase [Chondromyces crocatus]AKT42993.1 MBL fold metallo-hydrolase [Chondromyces crocatus]